MLSRLAFPTQLDNQTLKESSMIRSIHNDATPARENFRWRLQRAPLRLPAGARASLLALATLLMTAGAPGAASAQTADAADSAADLQKEVARLKEQNAKLQEQNARLQQQVAVQGGVNESPETAAAVRAEPASSSASARPVGAPDNAQQNPSQSGARGSAGSPDTVVVQSGREREIIRPNPLAKLQDVPTSTSVVTGRSWRASTRSKSATSSRSSRTSPSRTPCRRSARWASAASVFKHFQPGGPERRNLHRRNRAVQRPGGPALQLLRSRIRVRRSRSDRHHGRAQL